MYTVQLICTGYALRVPEYWSYSCTGPGIGIGTGTGAGAGTVCLATAKRS